MKHLDLGYIAFRHSIKSKSTMALTTEKMLKILILSRLVK